MKKILIVDDEPAITRMLTQILERQGYSVEVAHNGRDGLNAYKRCPADLVITDIFMPEKDGLELIWALREEYPQIKFIAISGGATNMDQDFLPVAKNLGARKTLAKPFSIAELLRSVAEELDCTGMGFQEQIS
jgi:CheY-like chemotaxis protein